MYTEQISPRRGYHLFFQQNLYQKSELAVSKTFCINYTFIIINAYAVRQKESTLMHHKVNRIILMMESVGPEAYKNPVLFFLDRTGFLFHSDINPVGKISIHKHSESQVMALVGCILGKPCRQCGKIFLCSTQTVA